MKVIRVIEPGRLVVDEERIPSPGAKEVLIKVKAAGICGSDISIFRGTSPVAVYPRVIGHEFAGEIVEVGSDVTQFAPGDRVAVDPVINCGACRICQKKRSNVCAHLEVLGVHRDGGYREYVAVPQQLAYKAPAQLSWEQAAIIEPYTVAAQVAARGEVGEGDTVLILGAGQIALTVLQVCKLLGATCIVTDIVANRLERARGFGADVVVNTAREELGRVVAAHTGGIGADVSIDAACVGKTLEQAAACTRSAGVVVAMGFADRPVPIPELAVTKNELDIRGSRLNNKKFPQVIEWFRQGMLDPSRIITHRIPFTEVEKGFDMVKNDPENTMKVILTFEE